jgi:ADP-heptose:LPS heptosyltransferase
MRWKSYRGGGDERVGSLMNKVLILKLDHIGDMLWAFPAVRAISEGAPGSELHLLCTPYTREAGNRMPGISKVYTYDAHETFNQKTERIRELREQKYNLAVVMGPCDKVNYLAWLSGAKRRIGYSLVGKPIHRITNRLFMTRSLMHPADSAQRLGKPLPHEVSALCMLATEIGVPAPARPRMEFPILESERESIGGMLDMLPGAGSSLIGVQLCSKAFKNGWLGEDFFGLLSDLRSTFKDYTVIVCAGPLEMQYVSAHTSDFENAQLPVMSGLSLGETAALIERLSLLVSWDTGVVHLATAVGTPVVDVFPSVGYDYCVQRWGPWQGDFVTLEQDADRLDGTTRARIIAASKKLLDLHAEK